eukprot:750433-Hanusia_phi.AAC.2
MANFEILESEGGSPGISDRRPQAPYYGPGVPGGRALGARPGGARPGSVPALSDSFGGSLY